MLLSLAVHIFFSCAQFRVLEYAIRVFFSPRIKMVIISLFGIVCVTQTSRHFYESHSLVWVWAHSSVICGWLCLIYTVSVNLDLHQNLVCLLHWKLFYPQWGVEMWLNGAKHWPLKYLANPHRLAKHTVNVSLQFFTASQGFFIIIILMKIIIIMIIIKNHNNNL